MPIRNFLDLPANIDHTEFEVLVHDWFQRSFSHLKGFDAKLREPLKGESGDYEIDILVRFEEFGADFVVLVECKHQNRSVEREVLQILHDRIRETGAHKGILFTTSSFQSGAVEYAKKHGICLIKVAEGKTCYITKSLDSTNEPPPWVNIPAYIGWIYLPGDQYGILSEDHVEYLQEALSRKSND